MGLDKAIEHGKEHRKMYYGAKAIDCSCRNHGTCECCKGTRLYKNNKRIESMNEKIKDYNKEMGWE